MVWQRTPVFGPLLVSAIVCAALALFAWRSNALTPGGLFQPVSREGALVLNNLFLTTATATVLLGTLYPLLVETVSGEKISVGAPFFNLTFGPLMVPLLLAVPFGPLLAWKRGDLYPVAQRLFAAFALAILASIFVYAFIDRASVFAALGVGLAVWLILGAATDIFLKSGLPGAGLSTAWRRFIGLPRSVFGTALAHAGLGVTVLGIVMTTGLEQENFAEMRPGQTMEIGGYTLRFDSLQPMRGPNFTEQRGTFTISEDGRDRGQILPSKRFYQARQMPTTEAGIRTFGASQLYVSLGDATEGGGIVVRAWWKPFVTLIWLGAVVMMVGGTLSLLDRRLRVGAPSARRSRPTAPAPAGG